MTGAPPPASQATNRLRAFAQSFVAGTTRWQLLALPVAAIVFFWPVLTGQRYFFEDIVQQFYPSLSFLANSLRHFQIPYWSPYVFSGIPYINDIQSQVFYPPNWLLAFFVGGDGRLSFQALEVLIVLHVLTSGLLMYALARELKLSVRAAVFCGLGFMFSGFMILRTIHLGVIYTYTWFPLLFLLYHRSLSVRRLHWAILAGGVFGLSALGGYPQTLMHMAYALGLYGLYCVVVNWRERRTETIARAVGGLALVCLVGVGIAAVQYLPSLGYVPYTVRSSMNYKDLVDASLRPAQLLTLLVPRFFGSKSGEGTDSVPFWGGEMEYHYWETAIYVGIIPLIIALFALSERRQPLRWYLVILAGLALLLALGRFTPLYRLALAVLPGFGRFRIPGRLSDLFTFGTVLLSGFGLDAFLRRGFEPAVRRLLTGLAIAAAAVVLVWALFATGSLRGLSPEFADPPLYANAVRQWVLFMVLALIALALVLFRVTRLYVPAVAFWTILVVTFVDLFLFGRAFNSTTEEPYRRSPELALVQEEQRRYPDEPFRVNSRLPRVAMLLGRNQGNLDRVELLEGYTPLGIARYSQFVEPNQMMLDLFNARFQCRIDSQARRLVLARNPGCLPRARMVYRYQLATSDSEALRMVKAGRFDYRNEVILEQNPGFPSFGDTTRTSDVRERIPGMPGDSSHLPANSCRFTQREAGRMSLDVNTEQTGVLVLSEVYYPEWQARLDGRLVDIYPVDFVLRGVTVPAGNHRVEFFYNGRRVRLGALTSLVTLVLALGAVVVLARRRPGAAPAAQATPPRRASA
jgi:hypothetical protein